MIAPFAVFLPDQNPADFRPRRGGDFQVFESSPEGVRPLDFPGVFLMAVSFGVQELRREVWLIPDAISKAIAFGLRVDRRGK